jgi:DNA polymerase-3 subunit beta
VIPPVQDAPARFDPALARAALRRVLLVTTEKTRAVKMTFGEGKIVLSVTSPEGGSAEEEVAAECSTSHVAGFNGAYLETMLEQIGGDTIELHHADAGSPAMFRRVVDDGARGVIMPMRV